MARLFQNFQFASAIRRKKQLPMTLQKGLYIKSGMASAYLGILPRAMIWFFKIWNYFFYVNYVVHLQYIWTAETDENISLVHHLVLVSSCVLGPCYSRKTHYPTLEIPGAQICSSVWKIRWATRIDWLLKIN